MKKTSTKAEPIKIELAAAEKVALEQIVRRGKSEQRIVGRAKIILQLAAGKNNSQIARQLETDRSKVLLWRGRWREEWEWRREQVGEEKPLLRVVEEMLSDKARAGAPATFSAEQIVQIIAVACEKPEDAGRPISHWSVRELADEVLKRGIVQHISRRSVGRFLKSGGVKTGQGGVLVDGETSRPRAIYGTGERSLRFIQSGAGVSRKRSRGGQRG